jgi:cation diffusion facilitator family transporter
VRADADASPKHHLALALGANATSAVVKLAAFSVTGAAVLLSEGLHSIADCGNQAALLVGHRRAKGPASAVHPLGRGRARYLWAFLVAVVVFGGGAVGSLIEATHRLLHLEHHPQLGLTFVALLVTAVIEGVSFGSLVRAANLERRPGERWVGFISRSRDPDLPVLLVEDVSDLVGLGLALTGTVLADLTGLAVLDAVASYLIAALLAGNAIFLAREMSSLILGEAPERDVEETVLAAVGAADASWRASGVRAVHLGPDELLVIVEVASGRHGPDDPQLRWLRQAGRDAADATPMSSRVVFAVAPEPPEPPAPEPPEPPAPEPPGPPAPDPLAPPAPKPPEPPADTGS